jgi:hypothetical protein
MQARLQLAVPTGHDRQARHAPLSARVRPGQHGVVSSYEESLVRLYQAAHGQFVSERKKLADELARGGDKAGAALLAKHTRPSVSVWAVNQLYRQAKDEFDTLFSTAARLRQGDLDATADHRKALSALVTRAGAILKDAGSAASEATLRRVNATLSALAAAGGFEPDPPGALRTDRDPPGFDAVGLVALPPKPKADKGAPKSTGEDARAAAAARAAEKRRAEEEAARARAERRRLEGLLRTAQSEVEKLTRERDEQKRAFEAAEAKLESASAAVAEFEARLASTAEHA